MGERGWTSSSWIAITGVALAAMLLPAAAAAHPAYVDAEFAGAPSFQCAEISSPCTDIADAIPFVESGLAVIVDDSSSPYQEQLTTDWPHDNAAIITSNFASEPAPGATSWTIDGGDGTAVTVPAGETTTVSGFNLRGNVSAVTVNGPATIANNTFDDPDSEATDDVVVSGPGPTSIINSVFDGASTSSDTAVNLVDGSGQATLGRNRISGYDTGVFVSDVTGDVSLNSELLAGNVAALEATDDVTVRNATFWNNSGIDITAAGAELTIDSSILEKEIDADGASSCAITFSRGPLEAPQPDPCNAFQTDDAPLFASPPSNLHLQMNSPMIDAGNPASTNLFRDIDGDIRALDGDGDGACPAESDIGADEFVGVLLDCSPPPDTTAPPPPPLDDTTPPETQVGTGPKAKTRSTSASFTFMSSEPGSSFECALDGAGFASCATPHSVKVKKGAHVLAVRARDAAGIPDPSPAEWKWTVKKRKKKKR